MPDTYGAQDARQQESAGADELGHHAERAHLPEGPLYLHDLAQIFLRVNKHEVNEDEFLKARAQWVDKFYQVHFERFSCNVAAGVAEVTPKRPPYDYRSQGRRRHLFKKRHDDAPDWHFWREALVTSAQEHQYVDLSLLLEDYSDLYLRATYYTDPEDSAFCHRLLRTGLEACIQAYDHWETLEKSARDACGKALRDRLSAVRDIYLRCAARRTVTQYTFGMLLGMLLIPFIVVVIVLSFFILDHLGGNVVLLADMRVSVYIGCTLGGMGAASSVLTRINSNKVSLDVESTRHGLLFWMNPAVQRGMARVVMGSLFGGLVAWCLYAKLLLPAAFLESPESRSVLTGVGAFVAGFSERFIPDLILRNALRKSSEIGH
jgi:hypothetical protein